MFAAIAMIDAASILIVRTAMLPKWIGWFGFFAAVALLAPVFFLPVLAFVLGCCSSASMMRRTGSPRRVIPPALDAF